MPVFEYQCLDCEQHFEYFHRTAGSNAKCPSCGGERLERQISLCGVSSEESRNANLSAAHERASKRRHDKQRSEHEQHHEHFGDAPPGAGSTH